MKPGSRNLLGPLPPLSLYIHFPWCIKKCPYCDFNSHELRGPLPESEYIEKMLSDLRMQATQTGNRTIETVFIGGGTPSLISGSSIRFLLNQVQSIVDLKATAEITLECNPGTLDQGYLSEYFSAGVNRLSIGVQSFQDKYLTRLGRIHSAKQAQEMIEAALAIGFDNINVDLMHGLPEQNQQDALKDLEMAVNQGVSHISWYQLTIEPNTFFYSNSPELPGEETLWSNQLAGQAYLESNSYKQYEVSAYALAGSECKHNLNYWLFGDYIGIGAGAHGKITNSSGNISRTLSKKIPNEYMMSQIPTKELSVEHREIVGEFLMNAMRLKDGFDSELFSQRTGLDPSQLGNFLDKAVERGLVTSNKRIKATKKGYDHLNELLLMAI